MKIFASKLILFVLIGAGLALCSEGVAASPAKTVKISRNLAECPVKFIRGALVAHDGTIWAAWEKSGVYRLTLSETYNKFWEDMRYFPGLPETEAFTYIAEDLQHRIWAGTDNNKLKEISAIAGLQMNLTMYVSRHSWASIAKSQNIPLSIISEGMGHDSENTTQIYLASLVNSMIDKANEMILKKL